MSLPSPGAWIETLVLIAGILAFVFVAPFTGSVDGNTEGVIQDNTGTIVAPFTGSVDGNTQRHPQRQPQVAPFTGSVDGNATAVSLPAT